MRGLAPRINVFARCQDVDGRAKPGHDEFNLFDHSAATRLVLI
jgi:hypothetical protein